MQRCVLFLIPLLVLCLFLCKAPSAFAEETDPVSEAAAAEPPLNRRIELFGGGEIDWPCGVPFEDPGFAAFDSDGQDRSGDVWIEGSPVVWRAGDYTILYFFSENDGQLAAARRLVHVVPQSLPETVTPPKGTICLTFDDGPCENTPALLDTLAKYNVKACFFIVANRSSYLDILPRIVSEGHTLGIHCNDHSSYDYLYKNETRYFTDLLTAQKAVHERTGIYAHVVRFPGGSRTASFLAATMEGGYGELYGLLADMGMRAYDWNVQPESDYRDTAGTLAHFTNPKRPYEYAVVLQHDTRYYSVAAVEKMICWALEQGYTFAALDETFPEIHFEQ